GSYPEVSLADARKLKIDFKRELAVGSNPLERKRQEKEKAALKEAIQAMTFARAAEEWFAQQAPAWSASHRAEWGEIDAGASLWRIPAEKMKRRREHVVPLSRQVLSVLENVKGITGASRYVFPSINSKSKPISGSTVRVALRSMGYENDQMTAHGFRTLASTNLNEQGWNSGLIRDEPCACGG
ncbi:MAG: site-specific integrase, partial [Synergistaceae bacterium]|nr:site-specific integrase [Synergistaceae bacterium]